MRPAWVQIGHCNKSLCGHLDGLSASHDLVDYCWGEERKLQRAGHISFVLIVRPREYAHRGKAVCGQILPPLLCVCDHLDESWIRICCLAAAWCIDYELRL